MKKVDMKNKKEFYITELNMGMVPGDRYELISTSDYAGPFTLIKARRILEGMFKNPGAFINPYNYAIRGPVHEVEAVGGDHTYKSEWYPNKDKKDIE